MDRLVEICNSSNKEEINRRCMLSEALDSEAVVLLGDPGMGKSYSFEYFSDSEGGELFKASNFSIYANESSKGKIVYIDGLDEERVSSDGKALVREIVRNLYQIKPSKIRISCRAIDWLGETDLQLFNPLFEALGSFRVLALRPLSEKDIHSILTRNKGFEKEQFLSMVRQKKIEYLLDNPLTLMMLVELVMAGIWPQNKFDLYYETVRILLTEKNEPHLDAKVSKFNFEQLLTQSGKLFAHLLIAGVQSITSTYTTSSSAINKSDIGFDIATVNTILSTKVFSNVSSGVFSPKHRTIAEFLGALWLAQNLKERMTLDRLLQVIGFDGVPIPELRGLFAWIASSNFFASDLLGFDPMGTLLYGDVERLSDNNKIRLLGEIEKIAEADPYFYPNQSHDEILGHLSCIACGDALEKILINKESSEGIKVFALKVIEKGPLKPELEQTLINCVEQSSDFTIREHAIDSIYNVLPNASDVLITCFRDIFNFSDDTKDLQVRVINLVYDKGITPHEVAQTLILYAENDLPIAGALYGFGRAIPAKDVGLILESLFLLTNPLLKDEYFEINNEFYELVNELIKRSIDSNVIKTAKLYDWLVRIKDLVRYSTYYFPGKGLASSLASNQPLLWKLFLIHSSKNKATSRYNWSEFNAISQGTVSKEYFFNKLYCENLNALSSGKFDTASYKLNLSLIDYGEPKQIEKALILIDKSSLSPVLKEIVEEECSTILDKWKFKNAANAKRKIAQSESQRKEHIAIFQRNKVSITAARDNKWLEFSANIYFGNFRFVSRAHSHCQRLENHFGNEIANILLDSLVTFVKNENQMEIEFVLESFAKNSKSSLNYAVLAGIGLYWKKHGHLDEIPRNLICSALPIERLVHTWSEIDGKQTNDEREWLGYLIEYHSSLVIDAYYLMAKNNNEVIRSSGISALCRLAKSHCAAQKCLKCLLTKAIGLNYYSLVTVFEAIELTDESKNELVTHASKLLSDKFRPNGKIRQFWIAVLFALRPTDGWMHFKRYFNRRLDITWVVISLFQRKDVNSYLDRYPLIRKDFIKLISKKFENCDAPKGGWSGSTNPWDAAQFVRSQVMQLSTVGSEGGTFALKELLSDKSMYSYSNLVKHALFKQKEIYRQTSYIKPNWEQTVNSLSCGRPSNLSEMQSVVLDVLNEIQRHISCSNTDTFKSFWNEDGHGKVTSSKNEESCRDRLIEYLESKLSSFSLYLEPESHMARDKRADILIYGEDKMKLPIEVKKEGHRELWTAAQEQLQRLYTSGINSDGYGIYLVFWFSGRQVIRCPNGEKPKSPLELEAMLKETFSSEKIKVFVMDVSGSY